MRIKVKTVPKGLRKAVGMHQGKMKSDQRGHRPYL